MQIADSAASKPGGSPCRLLRAPRPRTELVMKAKGANVQRELMERNARWAKRVNSADPTFFPRHFPGQRPEILWIGCKC